MRMLLFFALFAPLIQAQETHVDAVLITDSTVIEKGTPFRLGVHLKMRDHWHTYWENPGYSGLPTELVLDKVEGLTIDPLRFPIPKPFVDDAGFTTYGYDDEAVLIAPTIYTGSAEEITLKGQIRWLECKELCIPGSADVTLSLKVGDVQPANRALFDRYEALVPKAFDDSAPFRISSEFTFEAETWQGRLTLSPVNGSLPDAEDLHFFPLKNEEGELSKAEIRKRGDNLIIDLSYEAWEETLPDTFAMNAVFDLRGAQRSIWRAPIYPLSQTTIAPAASETATGGLGTLGYYLILAFIGGLILNLMPCVLPVLSLKVFALIKDGEESPLHRIKMAWVYTLGIMVTFFAISLFFAASKLAGEQLGIGFQLSNPLFVVFMTALVFVMALGFFGVFHFGAPNSDKLHQLSERSGAQGAFFMGALMTVLSTPCTAPFLGAAYGWALSQPVLVILLVFQVIALGLAFPYVLLCYMPPLLKLLPKPGAWMNHFKVLMGFLMLATVVWLLSVMSGLTGESGVIGVLSFLTAVGFAAYIIGQTYHAGSRTVGVIVAVLIFLLGGEIGLRRLFDITNPTAGKELAEQELRLQLMAEGGQGEQEFFAKLDEMETTPEAIAWVPYSPDTLQYFREQNRLIFLDFTADWCLTCKANERLVIDTKRVRTAFAEANAVVLRGDYTDQDPEMTAFINSFNRAGVPLYVVYPGQEEPILLPETITRTIVTDALDSAKVTMEQAAAMVE